jgi:hypothetical protein
MKNDLFYTCIFFCLFFCVGTIIWTECIFDKKLKTMNDSINRLIMIELITEQQFELLNQKVLRLERFHQNRTNKFIHAIPID